MLYIFLLGPLSSIFRKGGFETELLIGVASEFDCPDGDTLLSASRICLYDWVANSAPVTRSWLVGRRYIMRRCFRIVTTGCPCGRVKAGIDLGPSLVLDSDGQPLRAVKELSSGWPHGLGVR